MNPLFEQMNQAPQNPMQNMAQMLQQFQNFRNSFKGDPKQIVLNLLSNGQMTQQQFEQLNQMANQFKHMMH